MNQTEQLDRFEWLTVEIMQAINKNYHAGPISRDRVYEALNALAFTTAVVIRGCEDPAALEWFNKALNTNLTE